MLPKLLADPDRAKAKRVMDAVMKMKKIEVAALEKAAAKKRLSSTANQSAPESAC